MKTGLDINWQECPGFNELVNRLRSANFSRLERERGALLEVDDRTTGQVFSLIEAIQHPYCARYIMESSEEGTWEWMMRNGWVKMHKDNHSGWVFADILKSGFTASTYSIQETDWPINIAKFNNMVHSYFASEFRDFPKCFWKTDPAMINCAKEIYALKKIAIASFIIKTASLFMPISEIIMKSKLPTSSTAGNYVKLADAIKEYYDLFNVEGKQKLDSIYLFDSMARDLYARIGKIYGPVIPKNYWTALQFRLYRIMP